MARSLEGKKFFECYNNGIIAVISEESLYDLGRASLITYSLREELSKQAESGRGLIPRDDLMQMAEKGLRHMTCPIFSFSSDEARAVSSPWLTGGTRLYDALIKYIQEEGGSYEGAGFHVPFSNGSEIGLHGLEAMKSELTYITTERQFRETFLIGTRELEKRFSRA